MGISEKEVEITGSWVMVQGRMTEDDSSRRINTLIASELTHIATTKDGWEKLYQDPSDGRFWELFYPQSEMEGGGPPALRLLSPDQVTQKYRVH